MGSCRRRAGGPKIRLGRDGRAAHLANGKIVDNEDVVEGIDAAAEGRGVRRDARRAIHEKVKELNDHILPPE